MGPTIILPKPNNVLKTLKIKFQKVKSYKNCSDHNKICVAYLVAKVTSAFKLTR